MEEQTLDIRNVYPKMLELLKLEHWSKYSNLMTAAQRHFVQLGLFTYISYSCNIPILFCCCLITQLFSLFVTPWTTARQASLYFTISRSLLKVMSTESMMPPNISSSVAPFACLQSLPASRSFPWVSSFHQVAEALEFQLQHLSCQWIFRVDFL